MLARGTGIMTMDPIQRENDYKDGKRKRNLIFNLCSYNYNYNFFLFFFFISLRIWRVEDD